MRRRANVIGDSGEEILACETGSGCSNISIFVIQLLIRAIGGASMHKFCADTPPFGEYQHVTVTSMSATIEAAFRQEIERLDAAP